MSEEKCNHTVNCIHARESWYPMPPQPILSRRDEFAKAALIGLLQYNNNGQSPPEDILAQWAAKQADALIAELDKKGGAV